jgi:acid phosphatase
VGIVLAMIAALLSGGGATASAHEPKAPASPAEIVAYHDSGEWDADTTGVIRRARRQLSRHLTDHRPALVLDVDDTSLSSYDCLEAAGFDREKAQCQAAPAIGQTRDLYRYARAHGAVVFFVTGRRARMRAATVDALHAAGYEGTLHLRLRPNRQAPGTSAGWKARTRRAIERRGYTIVANVGDQRSDLIGGAALRAFKLPNPMYVIAKA